VEQSTGIWAAADAVHTDENVKSLLLSQEEPPNSQRNFTWSRGIHWSSVLQIIHKDLHLECCKKRRAQQLTEVHSVHALLSVCSLRDDNVITSKPTWKLKHANSILEPSGYFYQISSKSICIISSYTVSKLGRFFETQCSLSDSLKDTVLCHSLLINHLNTFLSSPYEHTQCI